LSVASRPESTPVLPVVPALGVISQQYKLREKALLDAQEKAGGNKTFRITEGTERAVGRVAMVAATCIVAREFWQGMSISEQILSLMSSSAAHPF
jgi:hypothetical protein